MKYYPGQGILFDTNTGHYQIDDYPKDVRQKAKDQAKRAFEGVTPDVRDPGKAIVRPGDSKISTRWEDDVSKFRDDVPKRK
jgi:hypothetical protein